MALSVDHDAWRRSFIAQLNYFADYIKQHQISSIFFGGGTPTLMAPQTAASIINHLQSLTGFAADIEITLEGNPTSVEASKLAEFRRAGINRVSLGVQSLIEADLKFLGREHNAFEAMKAVDTARNIFPNYSFDLIYARPGQTLAQWQAELSQALKFAGKHLSLYQLTIEKGTRFFSDYSKGAFKIPDEDLAADFYILTNDIMTANGLPAYEVSNHASVGFESRHNMAYWRYNDYLGIGPGAHSRITKDGKKQAIMMASAPDSWLKMVADNNNAMQTNTHLSNDIITDEMVMMGLRIKEGINIANFKKVTGQDIASAISTDALNKMIKNELLIMNSEKLYCTDKGMLLVNYIAAQLLS